MQRSTGRKSVVTVGCFMTIDDNDERTCKEFIIAFLQDKGYGDALPEGSTIVLRCVKMNDARLHGGRPTVDVDRVKDCTVFLTYPVTLAIVEVPTKKFSFYCTRREEARPPPLNAMVFMMANVVSVNSSPLRSIISKDDRKG